MNITIRYFALFRDHTGESSEQLTFYGKTVLELYEQMDMKYSFPIGQEEVRFAVNDKYVSPSTTLSDGDSVVFISPIAGG